MDPKILAALIATCAPNIHPHTMAEVTRIESANDPLAINVNRLRRQPPPQASLDAAERMTKVYIAKGYTVDIGLAQINSANLPALGITVEQAFDPCLNLKAGATILADAYGRARTSRPDEQHALNAALSAYNTGSYEKGFINGYVARYYQNTPAETAVPPQVTTAPKPIGFAPGVAANSRSYEAQIKAVMLTEPSG